MSDEPQPLRLKPRPPSGGEPPAAPPPPPPAPAPAADQGDSAARLRLKPRLNLAEEPARQQAAPAPEPYTAPAPEPPAPPPPRAEAPAQDAVPVFKLRPKNAAPPPAPPPSFAPPPQFDAPPEPYAAPPPEPSAGLPPPPPMPMPARPPSAMPPVSVLSAPPPPGGAPDAPPAPGSVPRLSMNAPAPAPPPPPTGKPALNIKVSADSPGKMGGKPIVKPGSVKPGKPGGKPPKPGAVLGKRNALGPVAKAGLGVLAIAVVVGGFYSYRIFFPTASKEIVIKIPSAAKTAKEIADASAKLLADGQAAIANRRKAEQAKVDAALAGEDVAAPTPTPANQATESVMAQTSLTSDVRVNAQHLDAAPAASAAFRTFVANANIGGVFQGTPSRALINGSIVREGQQVDSVLGIDFERIDSAKKAIFFKDGTGAEVSKDY